jgi:hypothetical protein
VGTLFLICEGNRGCWFKEKAYATLYVWEEIAQTWKLVAVNGDRYLVVHYETKRL